MADYLSDTGLQQLHRLTTVFLDGKLPEFVKNCNILNEKPAENMPPSAFADSGNRTFPVHTKQATYLSALYWYGQSGHVNSLPVEHVTARLEKAASYWGISKDVNELKKSIIEKTASPERSMTDSDYALVIDHGGEHIRRFPAVSPAAIKQSAESLFRDKAHYPYLWRKQAARNLLAAAATLEIPLDTLPESHLQYLVKAAGMYYADKDELALQLAFRSKLMPTAIKDSIMKTAEAVFTGNGNVSKLCELVDGADRAYKMYTMYDKGLPLPEELCFSFPAIKQASVDTVELSTGTCFYRQDLEKAGSETFVALGPDCLNMITDNTGKLDGNKVATVLPTIPKADAKIIEASLAAVGIQPVNMSKEAGRGAKTLFSKDEWLKSTTEPVDEDWQMTIKLSHAQDLHKQLKQKQV
jgi:hypothetical protein